MAYVFQDILKYHYFLNYWSWVHIKKFGKVNMIRDPLILLLLIILLLLLLLLFWCKWGKRSSYLKHIFTQKNIGYSFINKKITFNLYLRKEKKSHYYEFNCIIIVNLIKSLILGICHIIYSKKNNKTPILFLNNKENSNRKSICWMYMMIHRNYLKWEYAISTLHYTTKLIWPKPLFFM